MPLAPSVMRFLIRQSAPTATRIESLEPVAARQNFEFNTQRSCMPLHQLDTIEDVSIETRDGATLNARIYYPEQPCWAKPAPALLFFHAGGYIFGSIKTADWQCRMLAAKAQCAVVSVSYRLAPEYKFPYAVNDAQDALCWLHREAGSLAIDATRLAVGGESSGATLAAVCAVHARDLGIPLALQMLIYPALSASMDSETHRLYGKGYYLSFDTISWMQKNYLAHKSDYQDWRFAPLDGSKNAPTDWRNLAPAWIASAEFDPLSDEHASYTEKLRSHGNVVDLHVYEGMIHGFFSMGAIIPEAAVAHRDAARVLRDALQTQLEYAA